MKGAIQETGSLYYTDMKQLFRELEEAQLQYDWLITDFVGYPQDEAISRLFENDAVWLTGRQLTALVERDGFQWIWAMLSGFPAGTPKNAVMAFPPPRADGNIAVWSTPITIQHPLAELEIVAWDSSLTVLKHRRDYLAERWMKNNSHVKDLTEFLG